MADEFDPKDIAFVEAYIRLGFNASAAYRSICPDVQDNSSWELGSRMLRKVEVQELLKRHAVSAEEALVLLAERARDSSDKQVQTRAIGLALRTHGQLLDKSEVNLKGTVSWREQIEQSKLDGENSGSDSKDSNQI